MFQLLQRRQSQAKRVMLTSWVEILRWQELLCQWKLSWCAWQLWSWPTCCTVGVSHQHSPCEPCYSDLVIIIHIIHYMRIVHIMHKCLHYVPPSYFFWLVKNIATAFVFSKINNPKYMMCQYLKIYHMTYSISDLHNPKVTLIVKIGNCQMQTG